MATLSAQIQALTGTNVTETELDQFCEDAVRELTNMFPQNLKNMCYTKNTFTSAAAGSEAETIASKHIGSVYAGTVKCREIDPKDKYQAADSDSIHVASATDPVYYVEGGKLNILPASSSGIYSLINFSITTTGTMAKTIYCNIFISLISLFFLSISLIIILNNM